MHSGRILLVAIGAGLLVVLGALLRMTPDTEVPIAADSSEERISENISGINERSLGDGSDRISASLAESESYTDILEADGLADACQEAERIGLRFAQDPDPSACDRALRMMVARVPVLPGLTGFEIPDAGLIGVRDKLFSEGDDVQWSRSMEARILASVSELIDFPVSTLHVVCRSTVCGVLFVYSRETYRSSRHNYFGEQLVEQLGFSQYSAGSSGFNTSTAFSYIYLNGRP